MEDEGRKPDGSDGSSEAVRDHDRMEANNRNPDSSRRGQNERGNPGSQPGEDQAGQADPSWDDEEPGMGMPERHRKPDKETTPASRSTRANG